MADAPTFKELFRVARDEMLARNSELSLEVIEREGTDANALCAANAASGDEVIGQLVKVEADLYLDSAKGDALTRLVFDRYGLLRKPAAPALGSVVFTTTAPNPSVFAIPTGTKLQTKDGRQFITTASATFATGSTGPVTVAVRSVVAGLAQQAKIGTITSLITRLTGAPGDLAVTNMLATVGADDEEQDDELRGRAREFFTTARRGTVAAIQAAARAVPGVRKATAFENLDAFGRPAKSVQCIIADAFTDQLVDVGAVPPAYQAQSQVLAGNVFAALDEYRGGGVFVDVRVGQVVMQGIQLGLRFNAGVDPDTVALQARAVVAGTINALAPGEDLILSTLLTALRALPGLNVTGQEIVSPLGDVVVQPLQIVRTSLALVLAVSMQPTVALQSSNNPDAV